MNSTAEEQVLLSQRLHWGVFLVPAMATAVLAVLVFVPIMFLRALLGMFGQPGFPSVVCLSWAVFVLPGLLSFAPVWVAFKTTEYSVTTKRVLFRTGWLLTTKGELLLGNVEAVFLVEPLLGRLLGYGTVTVTGIGGTQFPLRFMAEPHRFHQHLLRVVEAVRSGRPVDLPSLPGVPGSPHGPPPPLKPAGLSGSGARRPEGRTPLEKAWNELNRPLSDPPRDDSPYMPKS